MHGMDLLAGPFKGKEFSSPSHANISKTLLVLDLLEYGGLKNYFIYYWKMCVFCLFYFFQVYFFGKSKSLSIFYRQVRFY